MIYGFLGSIGPQELLLLLLLGVLLFGRKLPEIGRSVGKSIVEFKKGMKGIEEEVSSDSPSRPAIEPEAVKPPQRITNQAPRFDDTAASNLPPKL
ncbi:twin-arginine translocase TatA/TatE family subunit [Limnoglobus roseus]|uniref:Sec-independent protein translocase protein TatA n=1 Tax=Limnoglobus roseus TaxID=2598579 RepID=A0A5C1ABY0_9BACT|nr:twin-arginine translocase TatA/TatE family subunit [Limnoglobus roseus]QEL16220.1 Sec-independent protein translocase protein TatAd [Limnoglobus roseus]